MDFSAATAALRTRLAALTLSPAMPIVWPNQDFKPESDGGESGWLYCETYLSGEEQTTFGSTENFHKDRGVLVVNVVVPRGEKDGRSISVAGQVRAHFLPETVDGIHFTARWIGNGRLADKDSRWFATPVIMEFWTDRLEASS
jgi:hypothetical protein